MPSQPEEQPRPRRGRGRRGASSAFPSPAMTIWLVLGAVAALAAGTLMAAGGGSSGGSAAPAHRTAEARAAATGSAPSDAAAVAAAGPSATGSAAASASGGPAVPVTTLAVGGLSTAKLDLGTTYSYLQPGYNEVPQWQRIDTAAAPDGHLVAAWQGSDGIHVTPLDGSGRRTGSDTVVAGAREVGGLVAFGDGFAVLTRLPDANKWNETAAYLLRYRGPGRVWSAKLTGAASDDTAPVLDGALRWDGTRFGAYFVVHGAGGPADGHYGDKLVYVDTAGNRLSGGWSWGCSHNEGIALWPVASGPFASLCGDDWRSGIFVSTGIGAPDQAPVIEREQCWAGYCGGVLGGLVRSPSGRFAAVYTSRGDASAQKNPADASGRGWTVTSRWATHQVAVSFLSDASTPAGTPVYLTTDTADDHVDARIAPYGAHDFLVSWQTVTNAACAAGTCTGTFAGTHLRVIDGSGRFVTPDLTVQAPIAGDIAVLPDGSLAWAGPAGSASAGIGATTGGLTVAVLHP